MLRRWRAAWPRRGHFWSVPPAQVAAAPPAYVPAFGEPAGPRPRGPRLARRGGFFPLVPAPPAVPPAYPPAWVEQAGSRPRQRPTPRRGQHFGPPWPQVAAAPPAFLAPPVAARRRLAGFPARRGRWYGPAWASPFVPTIYGVGAAFGVGTARPALKQGPPRRGALFEPPWPQVAAQPSVWRPAFVQAVRRGAGRPVRRGDRWEPPWPQVAVQPSVWIPGLTTAVRRGAGRPVRRGNFHEPPWPQGPQVQAAWPPELVRSRRPRVGPARRGRFAALPPAPAGVPAWLRARPRPAPSLRRRRRFCEPPWVEGPQTVWRPEPVAPAGTRPRWPTHRPRRGCTFFTPVAPPPPFTVGVLTAAEVGGLGTASDAATAALTATDARGGPT